MDSHCSLPMGLAAAECEGATLKSPATLLPRPTPKYAKPGYPLQKLGLFEKMRKIGVVNFWEGSAGFAFDIFAADQLEDRHSFAVIPPDLKNTKMCIDRELV